MLDRLQLASTPKYVRGFLAFAGLFVCKAGPAALQESLDPVQPGIFLQLLQHVSRRRATHPHLLDDLLVFMLMLRCALCSKVQSSTLK